MKASETIAERIRNHNRLRPTFVVEETGDGGWTWKVYDPRIRTTQGGPAVIAEGPAETRRHGHVEAHRAIMLAAAPRR